jgi:hypothetical protein
VVNVQEYKGCIYRRDKKKYLVEKIKIKINNNNKINVFL